MFCKLFLAHAKGRGNLDILVILVHEGGQLPGCFGDVCVGKLCGFLWLPQLLPFAAWKLLHPGGRHGRRLAANLYDVPAGLPLGDIHLDLCGSLLQPGSLLIRDHGRSLFWAGAVENSCAAADVHNLLLSLQFGK